MFIPDFVLLSLKYYPVSLLLQIQMFKPWLLSIKSVCFSSNLSLCLGNMLCICLQIIIYNYVLE